ncbi:MULTISPECIES: endonuclease domain-containing protein [Rhizobium]|nr:endonuclease domain-containing protein [Agrobacterium sp. ICMP 7243]MQB29185.1 endonuclease domain-containing protein [Rhizobium rhizogenes]NTF48009.1 endonuclease domain-containing protein [Rhizobium rhizogenes]NTF54560.1 endonuclease domain-containing protein [Rhizobium rhizogenes]NTF61082.1 endonuclease domain-containing protein [Rhizobium rhizogenes]
MHDVCGDGNPSDFVLSDTKTTEARELLHRDVPDRHRQFARAMRGDATKAENMLWQALRRSQLEGFKFKRQVPVDGHILDFVCFEARLIIEVDGAQHAESAMDRKRDAYFSNQGFRVLRVWNHEVATNLDGICLTILAELKNTGE